MHELALVGRVVAAVEARVRPAGVARVRIQIGMPAGVLPFVDPCGSPKIDLPGGKELRIETLEVQ